MASPRSSLTVSVAVHSTLLIAAFAFGGTVLAKRYQLRVRLEPTPDYSAVPPPLPEEVVVEEEPLVEPEPDTTVIAETFDDVEVRDDLPPELTEPARLTAEQWTRRIKPPPPEPTPPQPPAPPEPVVPDPAEQPGPQTAAEVVTEKVIELVPGTNTPPRYPALARRRGWQGTVLVEFEIDADGRVLSCRVLESSGFPVLDHAAVHTVKKWEFTGGPGTATQHVEFRLR